MNHESRVKAHFASLVACALMIAVFGVLVSSGTAAAENGPAPMPEWKGELLGAASYAALFGHNSDNSVSTSSSPPTSFNGKRPPNISPNTRVNAPQALFPSSLLGRSETTVTVSGEGKYLVAGWNDAEGFLRRPFTSPPILSGPPGLSGYGFSTDGGTTWTDGGTPLISGSPDPAFPDCGDIVTRGDPWLDTGGYGNDVIYFANLAVHEFPLGDPTCAVELTGVTAGISVHRGTFPDNSFAWDDVTLLASPGGLGLAVGYPLDFYDKEAIAADKLGSRQHVFISVTNFVGLASPATVGCGFGQIELWTSHDGGDTWLAPNLVQIDQVVTSPSVDCLSGRLNSGSQPAVHPNGDVFVAWASGPVFASGSTVRPLDVKIRVARCTNFGTGPCTTVLNEPINSLRESAPQGYNRNRIQDFPRIAVAQGGPFTGRIYVVYASGTGTPVCFIPGPGCATTVYPDFNILLKYSDNRGSSWSGPVSVNPPGDGKKDFWPVVAVDKTGNVDVVYVSSNEANLTPSTSDIECVPGAKQTGGGPAQDGKKSSIVDIFWAQSRNGGTSFQAPVKVTEVSSNWCKARTNVRPTFGDYIDARSFGNRVFVAWADGRLPAPAADTLAPPAGPRDRESDVFYSTITAIGRAPS